MRLVISLFPVVTLLAWTGTAAAQDAAAPPAQPPSVTKNCTNMKPKAKQECLKVAKQMDHDTSAPETSSSSSSVDTVHHSSPVMQTPEEKKAAAKAAKASKDAAKSAPAPKSEDTTPPANQ